MRGHIYGGIDADTREMRYIGQSISPVGSRPYAHERLAARGKSKLPVHCWLRSRRSTGRAIEWVVIEYLTDDDPRSLDDLEVGWISYFRALGCRLLNCDGGGNSKKVISAETRARMSISARGSKKGVRSPDVRRKLSEALKGRPLSATRKANVTAATRKAMSRPDVKLRQFLGSIKSARRQRLIERLDAELAKLRVSADVA